MLIAERIQAVLIKLETTSGVDSGPTGANVVRTVGIPTLEHNFMESGDRSDVQTGILSGADSAAPAGEYGRLPITLELRGTGVAYSLSALPEADPVLQIGLMGRTLDTTAAAEFVRYTTLDQGGVTATVWAYTFGGKLVKMVGCVATINWGAEVYKTGKLNATITGKVTSITEAAVPALTPQTTIPPEFVSAPISIASWNQATVGDPYMLLAATVDLGNVVADASSAGATDGLSAWLVTDRNVTQELTYHPPLLATIDMFQQARNDGSAPPQTSWQLGTLQYNKIITEARWKPLSPRKGSRNGLVTYVQSGQCKVKAGILTGGREVQITFK